MKTLQICLLAAILLACQGKGGDAAPSEDEPTPRRAAEPAPWQPDGMLDTDAFAWGLAVGDATPTTAEVGVRTSEGEVSLEVVVADGDQWSEWQSIDGLVATDQIVQYEFTGLQPDTAYSLVVSWSWRAGGPASWEGARGARPPVRPPGGKGERSGSPLPADLPHATIASVLAAAPPATIQRTATSDRRGAEPPSQDTTKCCGSSTSSAT